MMQDSHRAELPSLLDSYSTVIDELLELLSKEKEALGNRQFQYLESCTREKESLVAKLEELETSRRAMENSADSEGKEEIRREFNSQLGSSLKRCTDFNLANGGIIELSRQFNQRMLGIMLGSSAEENKLYDAQGDSTEGKPNQLFAKI